MKLLTVNMCRSDYQSVAHRTSIILKEVIRKENGIKSLTPWTIAGSRVVITAVKQYSFVDGLAICNTTGHYFDICTVQLRHRESHELLHDINISSPCFLLFTQKSTSMHLRSSVPITHTLKEKLRQQKLILSSQTTMRK